MTPSLLLDDILIWSAQVCFLVTVGALAALTLRHPRGRLVFWQGILAISLLLPAVQPWTQRPSADAGGVSIENGLGKALSAAVLAIRTSVALWVAAGRGQIALQRLYANHGPRVNPLASQRRSACVRTLNSRSVRRAERRARQARGDNGKHGGF